jgi:hypothetical protein
MKSREAGGGGQEVAGGGGGQEVTGMWILKSAKSESLFILAHVF